MRVLLATVMVVICVALGCTTHKVHRIEADKLIPTAGVIYSLPRTVLTVSFPITKTTLLGGKYCHLAKNYGIELPEKLDSKPNSQVELYALGAPTISCIAEPDPSQVFLIELDATPAQTRNWIAKLSELGLLVNAQSEVQDRTHEYVAATISAALNVASGLVAPPTMNEQVTDAEMNAKAIADQIYKLRESRNELLTNPKTRYGGSENPRFPRAF